MSLGNTDHGPARWCVSPVVRAVRMIATYPTEGPFHDPTLGQHFKSPHVGGTKYGPQQPTEHLFHALIAIKVVYWINRRRMGSITPCPARSLRHSAGMPDSPRQAPAH